MYSWEINNLLYKNNYTLSVDEYIEIIKSSQIINIKYEVYDDSFFIETDDNYCWRFKVRKEH